MKPTIDLEPLKAYFETVITPHELDELSYFYAQTLIRIQREDPDQEYYIHENADDFLFRLKELRDVLNGCE